MKNRKLIYFVMVGYFLGIFLGVGLNSVSAIGPDYYITWDYVSDIDNEGYAENVDLVWNTVRIASSAFSDKIGSYYEVMAQNSRGGFKIKRCFNELDLSNITYAYGIKDITYHVNVTSFRDDSVGSARLYVFNATDFVYDFANPSTDYDYQNHYFKSPVSYMTPNGYASVNGTGHYNLTMECYDGVNYGFTEYANNNMINVSFCHGYDVSNNAPSSNQINYIQFNIVEIKVRLFHLAGVSPIDDDGGWFLASIPYNGEIAKTSLYVRNSTNNYTWNNAVSNGILENYVYSFDYDNGLYYSASVFNGSLGTWIWYYEDGYELWHSNFSMVNSSGGCNFTELNSSGNWLYMAGFEFEPETLAMLVLLGCLYLVYKMPYKYFFVPVIVSFFLAVMISVLWTDLIDMFSNSVFGALFWIFIIVVSVLISFGKFAMFFDWFKKGG